MDPSHLPLKKSSLSLLECQHSIQRFTSPNLETSRHDMSSQVSLVLAPGLLNQFTMLFPVKAQEVVHVLLFCLVRHFFRHTARKVSQSVSLRLFGKH